MTAVTRVLLIEPAGNLWGSERALLEFADSLSGIEIAVCCPPETPIIEELRKRSIRAFPYFIYALHEKSRLQRLRAATGVIRACLKFVPDVIHLNQGGCYSVVRPAAVLFDAPIVAHLRIFEDVGYFAARWPHPKLLRAMISISSAVAREVAEHPGLSAIPNYMLYDSYRPVALSDPGRAARVLHRIACAGRIVPVKGQDLVVRAMHVLAGGASQIDCLMIGDGPHQFVERLKRMAGDGPGARNIHWLGARSDVVSLFETSVAVVCPSYEEALGRVIFEAWDAGAVPIVCERSRGAAEIISAAGGGILYDEQTPTSLAGAIQSALRLSQSERSALIERGREWMALHCDPQRYNRAFADILIGASKAGRRRA